MSVVVSSALVSTVVGWRKTSLRCVSSSVPVPGVLAVASRGSSVTMRLVRILVGVLVVLLHQGRVVPAVLRARGQTVTILPCPFVVIVLICRHQAAAFNR